MYSTLVKYIINNLFVIKYIFDIINYYILHNIYYLFIFFGIINNN